MKKVKGGKDERGEGSIGDSEEKKHKKGGFVPEMEVG